LDTDWEHGRSTFVPGVIVGTSRSKTSECRQSEGIHEGLEPVMQVIWRYRHFPDPVQERQPVNLPLIRILDCFHE
jgi:hypothetical protein